MKRKRGSAVVDPDNPLRVIVDDENGRDAITFERPEHASMFVAGYAELAPAYGLQALREARGLQQREAGERCGITANMWCHYENGRGKPTLAKIIDIVKGLQLNEAETHELVMGFDTE